MAHPSRPRMTKEQRDRAARELGAALRTARQQGDLSVKDLLQRLTEAGNEPRGTSLSPFYDSERGARVASRALVADYAQVLDRPDLLDLRDQLLGLTNLETDDGTLVKNLFLMPGDRPEVEELRENEELPEAGTVVEPRRRARQLVLDILAEARERARREDVSMPVVIAQLGALDSFRAGGSVVFESAVLDAVHEGVAITHLVTPQLLELDDPSRAIDALARQITLLEAAGDYEQLRLPSANSVPSDLIIAPGIGVAQLLPRDSLDYSTAAVFGTLDSPMGEWVLLMGDYARQLRSVATPVLTAYDRSGTPLTISVELEKWSRLADIEEKAGKRRLFKDGLSDLAEPLVWTRKYLQRFTQEGPDADRPPQVVERDISACLDQRSRRLAAFRRSAGDRNRGCVDIVVEAGLERQIFDDSVAAELRIDYLQKLRDLLAANAGYELLICPGSRPEHVREAAGWVLKEEDGVPSVFFYESRQRRATGTEADGRPGGTGQVSVAGEVRDPAMLAPLAARFDDLADRLRRNQSRSDVSDRLRSYIDLIESS